jgi:phenylalanyl-tRNA synthetase beta chain
MEVERIEVRSPVFEGVIVAEVTGLRPHPGGGSNRLATVHTGNGAVEVVTGAPNLRVGDRVPYAPVGARLRDQIMESKTIRGVASPGMLCSPAELGLGDDAGGILVLDEAGTLGQDLRALYPPDTILHLEIKSNRPDLLGHLGVAREIATIFDRPLRIPMGKHAAVPASTRLVTIEAKEGCRRFVGRLLEGVKVDASPAWLQARLRAAGLRPINNVVDVTNFVMLESGQPMHAFDFDRLAEGRLVVRRARPGERLLALDRSERILEPAFLVVADAERAQALAGVIGGEETAVGASTQRVLLEAATWEPRSIRHASKAIGLRTDASARFEKGLSPALSLPAVDRAASLLADLTGARAVQAADIYPEPLRQPAIRLTSDRLRAVLGTSVPLPDAKSILDRLGFHVQVQGQDLLATPPDFRLDCALPEDLVEEIGRVYGYDRVPSTLPGSRVEVQEIFAALDLLEEARILLAGFGFAEAVTYEITDAGRAALVRLPGASERPLRIANPIAEQRDALRVSLLPGLLEAIAVNLRQDQVAVRLFEIGTVFWRGQSTQPADERQALALAVHVPGGQARESAEPLRRVEAVLLSLRQHLAHAPIEIRQAEPPGFHPGRTAKLQHGGKLIGIAGEVHPAVLRAFDISGRVVAGEVLTADLFSPVEPVQARPLPRFPAVRRDLTVIVRNRTPGNELAQVMRELGGYTLREVSMQSEYQGPQLEAGARSLSFRLSYQADDRTLTGAEVTSLHRRIVDGIVQRFNVEVAE